MQLKCVVLYCVYGKLIKMNNYLTFRCEKWSLLEKQIHVALSRALCRFFLFIYSLKKEALIVALIMFSSYIYILW